jgi:thiol-disulfide isomerase/thioredoxin
MKLLSVICSLALVTSALAQGRHAKGEKPLSISHGAEVKLTDFLVPGKVTIFDFTSEYCPPCRAYSDPLLLLHQQRVNIAVVKVDINRPDRHKIDWESPVAQQYGLRSIPRFKVYGPDGKLIAEDTDDDHPARVLINQWLSSLQ